MDEMWGHFHFCLVNYEKQNKEKVEGGGGESSFHVFSCKIVVFNHFLSMHGRAEIGKRCQAWSAHSVNRCLAVLLLLHPLFQPTVAIKGRSISLNEVEQRFFNVL